MVRIAFRVDASREIGTGHVYRCLTLADELKARGVSCHFIMRDFPGAMMDELLRHGHMVHRLKTRGTPTVETDGPRHSEWLGASWEDDVAGTSSVLAKLGSVAWLVVDHYAIDCRWEAKCRGAVQRLMVIDDLADRAHECDLLLDQNPTETAEPRYKGLVPETCRQLLGPRYALLRPAYSVSHTRKDCFAQACRILVFFGGADLADMSSVTMDVLARMRPRDFVVDLVLGSLNSRADELEAKYSETPWVVVHRGCDMAGLMNAADLAIGAAGVTALERLALSLPSVIISIAENQLPGARAIAARGAALYLGEAHAVNETSLEAAVRTLVDNHCLRRHMADRARAMVDGRGTARVATELLDQGIVMAEAGLKDCDRIWTWRNAEVTRRYFNDTRPIALDAHRRWFSAALAAPDCHLLVGNDNDGPVGVVRLDRETDVYRVSIYLVPGREGRGKGRQLLDAGVQWLRRNLDPDLTFEAEVLADNAASRAMFEGAGFEVRSIKYRLSGRGAEQAVMRVQ